MDNLTNSEPLCDDLLDGAEEIARFTGWPPRRVYYLLEKKLIPAFKVGTRWTARKSSLQRHFEELESGE